MADVREFRRLVLARDNEMLRTLLQAYRPVMRLLEARIVAVSELIARRAAAGEMPTAGSVVRLAEYQELQRAAREILAQYTIRAGGIITAAQQERVDAAVRHSRALVEGQLPGGLTFEGLAALGASWITIDADALQNLVGAMRDGSSLNTYLRSQIAHGTVEQLAARLTAGMLDNPRVTARAIRDQLQGGGVQALRVARSETLRSYREAERAQYAANSTLIKGYRRVSAQDSRTCAACWIMDGTLYASESELDEHVSGRCFTVPELVSPRELGIDVDVPPLVERGDTGRARFQRMSEPEQRAIVGNDRLYNAYRDRDIGLNGLIAVRRDPVWGQQVTTNSAVAALRGDHAPRLPGHNAYWTGR